MHFPQAKGPFLVIINNHSLLTLDPGPLLHPLNLQRQPDPESDVGFSPTSCPLGGSCRNWVTSGHQAVPWIQGIQCPGK